MIDIPIGKALIAVHQITGCDGCLFYKSGTYCPCFSQILTCQFQHRSDGKNVIFKLVDMPKEAGL